MSKKKNLIIFGTRPEAIKMAPLVMAFLKKSNENGEMARSIWQLIYCLLLYPDYLTNVQFNTENQNK